MSHPALRVVVTEHAAWSRLRHLDVPPTVAIVRLPPRASGTHLLDRLHGEFADRQAAVERQVARAYVSLAHAAQVGGTREVIDTLARTLNGWAVLLDSTYDVVYASGAGKVHLEDAVAFATSAPRRVRHRHLLMESVGAAAEPRGRLVVHARNERLSMTRTVTVMAARLVDLTFHPQQRGQLEILAREGIVDILLHAPEPVAELHRERWGFPEGALAVMAVQSRSRAVLIDHRITEWLEQLNLPLSAATRDGTTSVVLPAGKVSAWCRRIEDAAAREALPLRAGLGAPMALRELRRSADQARLCLDVSISTSRTIVAFQALNSLTGHSGRWNDAQGRVIADPVLQLRERHPDGDELVTTLQVFLAQLGNWSTTSRIIGVHRHTIRSRLEAVKRITGLDMDDADDRCAAWLALQAAAGSSTTRPRRAAPVP